MTGKITRPFKLAVFDVAGTTVMDDDAVADCLTGVLAERVPVTRAAVLRLMGLPKPLAIRELLSGGGLRGDALDRAVDEAFAAFRKTMINRYRGGSIEAAEGAEEVFEALRASGVRVALDTGFSRDVLDVVLERLKWAQGRTVDFTLASDEVERGRPFPDLIYRAMALAQVADPGMVVKIGDTPADLEQGLAAKCGCVVGVTYGTHNREQLERRGVHVIDRLADLLPLIGLGAA